MKTATKMMVALLVVLALVASACGAAADKISEQAAEQAAEELMEAAGNGDVSVDVSGNGDDQTIQVGTDEGSVSIGAGSEMPDAITIPVPDDGTIDQAVTSGDTALVSVAYDPSRYDEIVAFYEDWVTKNGGEEWEKQVSDITTDEGTIRGTYWMQQSGPDGIRVGDCAQMHSDGTSTSSVCVTIQQGG